MHDYQYSVILFLFALCLNSKSRPVAIILIIECLFYSLILHLDISASNYIYYYSLTATLCLFTGLLLSRHNQYASFCSYALVLISLYGACQWVNYLPHNSYDVMFALITIIQLISVTPKGLVNGLVSNQFGMHTNTPRDSH